MNRVSTLPPRSRFFIGVSALFCWLIPFGWLQSQISNFSPLVIELPVTIETMSAPLQPIDLVFDSNIGNSRAWLQPSLLILVIASVGLLLFVFDLTRSLIWHTKDLQQSEPATYTFSKSKLRDNYTIRIITGSSVAMTSGLFKPVIWIGSELIENNLDNVAIIHEAQHLNQNDHWWLLICQLIHRLHWWNPVVWKLHQSTLYFLEASCDQKCKNLMGNDYQIALAQISLLKLSSTNLPLASSIASSNHSISHRLELLNKEFSMTKKRYIFLTIIPLFLSASLAVSISGKTTEVSNTSINHIEGKETRLSYKNINLLTLSDLLTSAFKLDSSSVHPKIAEELFTINGNFLGIDDTLRHLILEKPLNYKVIDNHLFLYPVDRDYSQWIKESKAQSTNKVAQVLLNLDIDFNDGENEHIQLIVNNQGWGLVQKDTYILMAKPKLLNNLIELHFKVYKNDQLIGEPTITTKLSHDAGFRINHDEPTSDTVSINLTVLAEVI